MLSIKNLLFGNGNRRLAQPDRRRTGLHLEVLEDRLVPASVGVKTAVLDFNGQSITAAQMADGGWTGYSASTQTGFRSLFTNSRMKLNMNGDSVVNDTDATLMINAIVARVQADYAPYNINIVAAEMSDNLSRLSDALVGDVFVVVTGGVNNVDPSNSSGIFGIAPFLDAGNGNDDIAFAFGKNMVDAATTSADVINRLARTISHEMGHTFGLDHIIDTAGDAVSHHLMNKPNSDIDPRDFTRDFVFQDRAFNTGAGLQNAHEILSRSSVLGPSTKAWSAVLNPGTLTIVGTETTDDLSVTGNTTNTSWTVTGAGATVTMTVASVNTASINPFDANLTKIIVRALNGHDKVTIGATMTATTEVYGGEGWDMIYGGGGQDYLFGGGGTDYLYGRGGDDYLLGGTGSDYLYGGQGKDWLTGAESYFGSPIRDYTKDYLYGEGDANTIINFRDDFLRPEDEMTTGALDTVIWYSTY